MNITNSAVRGFPEAADEARHLIQELRALNVEIAIFGSIAVWEHARALQEWMQRHRRPPRDIDAAGSKRHRRRLREYMDESGYHFDERLAVASEGTTYAFTHEAKMDIEVRFGALEFSHTIPLNGCLHEENGTIPLAELLLSKLLIAEVNEADARDMLVLLAALNGGSNGAKGESSAAVADRIESRLNQFWGPWYTATQNLAKVPAWLGVYGQHIPRREHDSISLAANDLNRLLHDSPKSIRWRLRCLLGRRIRWYRRVSEKEDLF